MTHTNPAGVVGASVNAIDTPALVIKLDRDAAQPGHHGHVRA